MTLKKLLNIHGLIDWRSQDPNSTVSGIYFDSRQFKKNGVYIAIRGNSRDGHDFISDVVKIGAIALVVEDKSKVPDQFNGVVVEVLDSKLTLQVLSQKFYDFPGDQLTSIAVTGTNGKTSTTFIVEYLLGLVSRPCGVIGTIDHHLGDKKWETDLTTPDPLTLQKRLREFLDLGAEAFIMEASSHALKQSRIDQGFNVCLFTNLSRDHLDYHPDMEDYFLSKAKLFSSSILKKDSDNFAIINGDDPYGLRLAKLTSQREVFLFGQNDQNHFQFKILKQSLDGCEVELCGPDDMQIHFFIPLSGEHNVYNTVGSLVCLYVLGHDIKILSQKMKDFKGIPGRVQSYKSQSGVYTFVDYAHTPEALEKVIHSLKVDLGKNNKLITVFGCGGDRDKGKRPLMGEIASRLSDITWVTSDNPRTENPKEILEQIVVNIKGVGQTVFVEVDRANAIRKACLMARPGDVILVAGKGHEDYQIIGNLKSHFSDREQIIKCFSKKN